MPRFRSLLAAVVAVLVVGAVPASATAPATLFDAPGQVHAWHCATPASAWEPLRFADARETGFGVTSSFQFTDPRCPSATVRLDLHELLPSTAGPLVFHRGGNGYVNDQNVKYGELAVADLSGTLPGVVTSSGGRGAPCDLAADAPYAVQVRSIPREMKYKRPQDVASGNNSGASFLHYGDPGADQGDRKDIHYSYLVWSFVDVRGGGHVRTLLAPGQTVRLCDVEPVTMNAWDRDGNVNGQVTARYVQIHAGSCPLYGWMVWEHEYDGNSAGVVSHAVRPSVPPPAPPAAGDGCPVAEPASPPVASTGDGATGGSASATLAGTVNQKGVPTTWWFEYGPTSGYGSVTPTQGFGSTTPDRVLPVSAAIDGLQPGTEYHYRLVASNAHGVGYGPDRVLATPAQPAPVEQPPPVAQPAAAIVMPALRSLKLTPSTFKRKRSARGSSTRIWLDASVTGTVKMTFKRQVRRRWVTQRGTLTKRVSEGRRALGFGGWVGTRKLPAGRYVLRAVPYDAEGRVGSARHARFTLR